MKKFLFVISLLICSLLQVKAQQSIDSQLQKLLIAESAIENLYVDKVEDGVLVEAAIRGMLEELDPHSTYLTADEVEKSNESLQGNFDGIGIQCKLATMEFPADKVPGIPKLFGDSSICHGSHLPGIMPGKVRFIRFSIDISRK